MGPIRNIIREELSLVFEGLENIPELNDPEKCAELIGHWQSKARNANQFYWKVSDIVKSTAMGPVEKIEAISHLFPNYGWV